MKAPQALHLNSASASSGTLRSGSAFKHSMVPNSVAVMDALHSAVAESCVLLQRRFEIRGVSDMITALGGVRDHFFFLKNISCSVLCECMLSPFLCLSPADLNALITACFHCWDGNMHVCVTPLYGVQEFEWG